MERSFNIVILLHGIWVEDKQFYYSHVNKENCAVMYIFIIFYNFTLPILTIPHQICSILVRKLLFVTAESCFIVKVLIIN